MNLVLSGKKKMNDEERNYASNKEVWDKNMAGYNQVLARLKYLEAEKDNIDPDNALYEFLVIKGLIDIEPSTETKKGLWKLVKGEKD